MEKEKKDAVLLPSMEQIETERRRIKYHETYRKSLRGTVYALVIVAAIAVLISFLLLPILQISGDSMNPTLCNGEIIIMFKTNRFETGDLCSFSWNNKTLIKRIIAGPGDWIKIDEEGVAYINGEVLDEPYVSGMSLGDCDLDFPYQVPEKSYFVMGDKRDVSIDSRNTVIGSVHEDQSIGKVWFRIYPFNKIGIVR